MLDNPHEPLQVDMLAASLRADRSDLNAFMEALASKLGGSLPEQTQVTRQNKLFSREHPVIAINVALGESQYQIVRERQGYPITSRAKIVRGIVIKTEQIPMEQWIDEIANALATLSTQSMQARMALERFLL
jgi:hypothetical protein